MKRIDFEPNLNQKQKDKLKKVKIDAKNPLTITITKWEPYRFSFSSSGW